MAIDYKKFDKTLFAFLKKQPQKFGDISHIANEFINGDPNNKQEVIRQLYYLRGRNFLRIEDLPEDPLKLQDDWWGTLQGHNPIAGYKVEDLKAQLSAEYEKLSWFDRNPIKTKILEWVIPFILGILATLFAMNSIFGTDKQSNIPEENKQSESIVSKQNDIKDGGSTKNHNSLLHNKDSVLETLTSKKDTAEIKKQFIISTKHQ